MDEDFEYDLDVLEHLDNLAKLSINILNIYKRLLVLESQKKDSPYYNEIKELLIQSLTSLKQTESEEYNFFSDNYSNAVYALDYLEENYEACSDLMDHDAMLCYTRVHEKLSQIEIIQGINDEYEENKRDVTETKKYKLLRKLGYDEEDAVFLYLDYSSILDDSISLRYASLLEDEIASKPNKEDYIKMRLEESFASPNDLEDTLITLKFGPIPRNLDEELTPPYNFTLEAKRAFIKSEIDDCLLDIVNKINNTKDKYELASCIILFKTYLLYLTDEDIKRVIGLVSAWIQDENLSEELTKLTYSYKELQASQNKDNNKQIDRMGK